MPLLPPGRQSTPPSGGWQYRLVEGQAWHLWEQGLWPQRLGRAGLCLATAPCWQGAHIGNLDGYKQGVQ